MNKIWSTLAAASFAAFFATGCMTPDVSNTYQPQAGDVGMRAYGSSGCIDFEQQKAQMLKEQQEWHESHAVAATVVKSSVRSEASYTTASTSSVADDGGWVEVAPTSTSVEDDGGWVAITP